MKETRIPAFYGRFAMGLHEGYTRGRICQNRIVVGFSDELVMLEESDAVDPTIHMIASRE